MSKIEFEWNKQKALQASKIVYDWDMKHSPKRFVGWLFIALTQFGIVGALKHNAFGLLFISTFLVLYWYVFRWQVRKYFLNKFYAKQLPSPVTIVLDVTDEGITHNNQLFSWDEVYGVRVIDDAILLQLQGELLFFSKDAFATYEEFQEFKELLTQKGKI